MQPLKGAMAVPDFAGKEGTRICRKDRRGADLARLQRSVVARCQNRDSDGGGRQAMAEALAAIASEAAGPP